MSFGKNILKYKEEMLKDLEKLISFQSISGEQPEECVKALNFVLDKAKEFGLNTKNVDDIAISKFTEKDVVRHRIVQDIIKAYSKYEENKR